MKVLKIANQWYIFQVVDFLNDLYTLFDGAIDQFKVYKVMLLEL